MSGRELIRRRLGALAPEAALRAGSRARRRGRSVSVVALVTDTNVAFLGELVDSLGAQRERADEIVLVTTATSPDALAMVDAAVASSWRVRNLAAPPVTGSAQAVDLGVRASRSSFVLAVEAGDVLHPEALGVLAAALAEHGSAVAVGGAPATATLSLDGTPDLLERLDTAAVMVARERWHHGLARRAAGPVGSWLPWVRVLLEADRVSAVATPVRAGDRRGGAVAVTAMEVAAPHAGDFRSAVDEVLGALDSREPLRRACAVFLATRQSDRLLDDVERCTDDEWAALTHAARAIRSALEGRLADVPVLPRVALWLAAEDRRDDLVAFALWRWAEGGQHPTQVADGVVRAELPVDGLPDGLLVLSAEETPLVTELRRVRREGDDVEVEVLAYVRGVGHQHGVVNTGLHLVALRDGLHDEAVEPVPVGVELRRDPVVDVRAGERFQDQAGGVLVGRFPATRLEGSGRHALRVRWECAGVVRDGRLGPLDPPAPPVGSDGVVGITLEGADLVLAGRGAPPAPEVAVQGPRGRATGPVVATPDGFAARVALAQDRWGRGATGLPSGRYRLVGAGGTALELSDDLLARIPLVVRSQHTRAQLLRGPQGGMVLQLGPPLADEEIGPAAQQRLRASYAASEDPLDPELFYFQAFAGEASTDSPRAIHEELHRRRPDLRLVWAVADRSVELPAGAEAVVVGSRAHYDALARASWVVTNNDLESWFVRRPGQRVLQTYHGYPSKAMGLAAWLAKGLTPGRVARQLSRTSATWSLLLTPDEAMDEHYRREYRYEGPILAAGYPRDDALVGPDAAETRERTRAALGVGDRVAVLYAPTWRDDLATNFRNAPLPTAFDVEAAAEALGPDYVLLLRGHRFHRQRPSLGARLIDVTEHPEVDDLVLAADVAVLDYSSLRFDIGLAGRPMVFFVPDVVRYGSGVRGFLYDFVPTAPGPHVATTDEVVAALRDPAALRTRYAADLDRFRARFHRKHDGHAARRVVDVLIRVQNPGTDH